MEAEAGQPRDRPLVRPPQQHHAVAHVADDELQPRVAIEVGEQDVGDHRRRRRPRRRQPTRDEPRRRGRRPVGGPGKRHWRARQVRRQRALEIGRQRRAGRGARFRAVADPLHADHFVPPRRSGRTSAAARDGIRRRRQPCPVAAVTGCPMATIASVIRAIARPSSTSAGAAMASPGPSSATGTMSRSADGPGNVRSWR